MANWSDLSVLIPHPDGFGASVVDLGQLLGHLDDDETLDDAIANSAFDGPNHLGPQAADELAPLLERIRRANNALETGTDPGQAYWSDLSKPGPAA